MSDLVLNMGHDGRFGGFLMAGTGFLSRDFLPASLAAKAIMRRVVKSAINFFMWQSPK